MQPVGSTDNLPQIPEPDGSYMLNQKFVIPIYKKSAGICTCYSSHTSKALHCPLLSERATQKPTPICITTLEYTLSLTAISKGANFRSVKNKTSSKRLFYICIFPTSLTSLRKYRRGKRDKDSNLINRTKIYSAIFSDVS